MIRVSRPFDRWFDLSDPYDDLPPGRPSREAPRPEAHREWTYDAPRTPVPVERRSEPPGRGEPETPRPPC